MKARQPNSVFYSYKGKHLHIIELLKNFGKFYLVLLAIVLGRSQRGQAGIV